MRMEIMTINLHTSIVLTKIQDPIRVQTKINHVEMYKAHVRADR